MSAEIDQTGNLGFKGTVWDPTPSCRWRIVATAMPEKGTGFTDAQAARILAVGAEAWEAAVTMEFEKLTSSLEEAVTK